MHKYIHVHINTHYLNFCTIAAQCPAEMSFQQCGLLCPQVCGAPAMCSLSGCAEGCFCPAGQVADTNGQCVLPDACGQFN